MGDSSKITQQVTELKSPGARTCPGVPTAQPALRKKDTREEEEEEEEEAEPEEGRKNGENWKRGMAKPCTGVVGV